MADMADQAGELIERRTQEAMARLEQGKAKGPSLAFCVDCDDEIPEKRRAMGGVRRCVCCQEVFELRTGA